MKNSTLGASFNANYTTLNQSGYITSEKIFYQILNYQEKNLNDQALAQKCRQRSCTLLVCNSVPGVHFLLPDEAEHLQNKDVIYHDDLRGYSKNDLRWRAQGEGS